MHHNFSAWEYYHESGGEIKMLGGFIFTIGMDHFHLELLKRSANGGRS